MENNGIAFQIFEIEINTSPGWTKVTSHLVFDMKMGFIRKVRYILDKYRIPDPIGSTYARVISCKSAHIAFTYATLNNLPVFAANV